jgi:putative salt-induced outer membrane protein YdiY
MLLALALSTVLAQSDATATQPVPSEPQSAADKAADAALKAAEAAQKAAEAAMRIADAVAPAPAAAATPASPAAAEGWKGSVGLGLTFITGNSQTLTLTGTAAADRKWDAWSLGIRLGGAYGLANPDTNTVGTIAATTARRANGTIRGDRAFGGFASIFVLAGSEFDHMKNIESRTIGEAGAGLTFFNKKEGDLERLYLRVDLAARGGYESRFQYFPTPAAVNPYGIIILAPRAAVTFRWGFSKDVRISEEIEFIPFVLAPALGRLLINNTTKLNARLTENLSLSTAFVLNFDSQPPEGAGGLKRKETDVALTVGLEAAF